MESERKLDVTVLTDDKKGNVTNHSVAETIIRRLKTQKAQCMINKVVCAHWVTGFKSICFTYDALCSSSMCVCRDVIMWHYRYIVLKFQSSGKNLLYTFGTSRSACCNILYATIMIHMEHLRTLIARFMGPTWGPSGADRTQMGPMLSPWTLLSGRLL